ncbi:HNH endonuclease [Micrococcales bacterium KH10]|nr:HNH endonuclease [Micrococcales bacterium KH10]
MGYRPDLATAEWKAQAERVKARDGHVCTACGSDADLTVDHIVPHAVEPGPRLDSELVTLCRRCNGRKSDKVDVRLTWRSPRWQ